MMKRAGLGALATAGMVLSTFSTLGTVTASASATQKVTITLWYYDGSLDPAILKQVSKAFPNVNLQAQDLPPGPFENKLLTSLYAGNAPDITTVNSDNFVATVVKDHNQFVNLNNYPEVRKAKSDYLPWKWNLASTPDHQYQVGIPIDIGPTVLYYNTHVFAKAGLPTDPAQVSQKLKTWKDYFNAADQMKARIHVPMFDNIGTVYEAALVQSSQTYFNASGQPIYATNPAVKTAWNLAVEAFKKGEVLEAANGTDWNAEVSHDAFGSAVGASWHMYDFMSADSRNGVWKVAAAPGGSGDNGGSFLSVTKTSKHPELAAQIALWLLSPQHQSQMYPKFGLYPSTPASYSSSLLNGKVAFLGGEDPNTYFSAAAKQIKVGPENPNDGIVDGAINQQLALVATSHKNPTQAWNDAMASIKRQLAQAALGQ